MSKAYFGFTLSAILTAALPANAAPDSYSLGTRLGLSSDMRQETLALDLKSPGLAVGCSLGVPWLMLAAGGALMATDAQLGGAPVGSITPLTGLGLTVGALSPLGLGAGQAYAGDPWRGLWVGLGSYGASVGGLLAGMALAYAVAPQQMASGGQSAGLTYAFVAMPIQLLVMGGYTIWALSDAHHTAVRANETTSSP